MTGNPASIGEKIREARKARGWTQLVLAEKIGVTKAAMDEGLGLIRAKADAKIIVPLIACAPRVGARVVYTADTQGGMFSGYAWPVTILEGQFAGCRGFVPSSSLKK